MLFIYHFEELENKVEDTSWKLELKEKKIH